jgi:uncharacterized protein YjiS (DUF1127 family)
VTTPHGNGLQAADCLVRSEPIGPATVKLDAFQHLTRLRFTAGDTPSPQRASVPRPARATSMMTWIRRALRAWAEARRERALRAALAKLDGITLRDLGITRSEIGSVAAEWAGRVEPTRRLSAPRNVEVFAPNQSSLNPDYCR